MESPDATKLPVKLAIGLLKDSDGLIALDLPLTGSPDDPTFSIWGLVGKAFKTSSSKSPRRPSRCWARWWAAEKNCNLWSSIPASRP